MTALDRGLPSALLATFARRWDALVLTQVMREVLIVADPDRPHRVTQRDYDQARVGAGFEHTPRADKLAARYGLPWRKLVPIVVADPDAARTIARATHPTARLVLTHSEAVRALATVAVHLGADELSPAAYEHGRRSLNAAARRRHLHGRAATPLPSVGVIREKFSFAALADAAGLAVTAPGEPPLMTRAAAVTLFIEHCGFVPRQLDLRWFAAYHRVQLVDKEHERHRAAVAAAHSDANRRGRWFPARSPESLPQDWHRLAQRDSAALTRARDAFPAARKAGYSIEEVRESIRRAFDLLDPGQTLTQERYRALSVAHRLPSPSVIQRLGRRHETSFGALVREIAAERASETRAKTLLPAHG